VGREASVDVVGVVGGEVFGPAARAALDRAAVCLGSPRHLARFPGCAPGRRVALTGALEPLVEQVAAHLDRGEAVTVLASGDPGFFGITRLLVARLGRGRVRTHPAPSSVALAFAAAGLPWDDAVVVSAHGRSLDEAAEVGARAPKAAVLTAPANPPEALGAALVAAGCGPRTVTVASRLGEMDEAVVQTDLAGLAAGRFDPMSVVVLAVPDPATAPTLAWGRDEDAYSQRPGMITKAETRAVALARLRLPRAGVLWDVGAGSGSVGVEAATFAPGLRVFAVERVAADAAHIGTNARAAGVSVEVVVGEAPAALAGLPDPDRVFVGGGGLEVVEAAWARLRPGGVLVATFVVLDRAVAAVGLLGEMVQLHVDRCVPIGSAGLRLEPLNPVFVCWGTR
jgi:precorrin-6B C5,15-methyltransferase / cobalt-precorrin-6B C5,C15-methyltransferase